MFFLGEDSAERKTTKQFLLLLFLFFGLFYVFFPLLISQFVGKPATFVDWFPMSSKGGDYIATYVASKALLDGHNIYLNNASLGDEYRDQFAGGADSRYSYTPLQAVVLSPLSILSFEDSRVLWAMISALLILVGIVLISSLAKHKTIAFVFLAVFYGLSSFFWFQIERGQTDALLVFFLSLSLYLYLKKRNAPWAALFFSLAVLLKVFPLLLVLFFLLRKEYKFLIYTLLFSLLTISATGLSQWSYWLFDVLPNYANYYLGAEVDHSLAYLLSGFWDSEFPRVVRIARIVSVFFVFLYITVGYLSKHRHRNHLLIELAVLSIIAEISTPWSANYKLVTLLPLFAAPFFLLGMDTLKNRVLLTIPLLVAFLLLSPIYNEFYGRFPFSFLSIMTPGELIPYHPIQKIAEFRVSLSLLFCLFYLLSLQTYLLIRNKNFFQSAFTFLRVNRIKVAAIASILFLATVSLLVYSGHQRYQHVKTVYLEQMRLYGKETKISDSISLAGFDVKKKVSGSYDIELIIKVNKDIHRHLALFIHGYPLDQDTTEGTNFFPYLLVNFWSAGKHVVIHKTVNFTARPQNIAFGLFDVSNGERYGEAVELGVIHLNELR